MSESITWAVVASGAALAALMPRRAKNPPAPAPITGSSVTWLAPVSGAIEALRARDESRIARLQRRLRCAPLDRALAALTLLGHEEFYVLGLSFILFATSAPGLAVRLMVALPTGIVVTNALKNTFGVERPSCVGGLPAVVVFFFFFFFFFSSDTSFSTLPPLLFPLVFPPSPRVEAPRRAV
jgi:hypothetical protein